MTEGERRRRRVRGTRGGGAPDEAAVRQAEREPEPDHTATTSEVYDEAAAPVSPLSIGAMAASAHDDRDERSLRGLIGGGSSQVSVRAAMRARDASRPSDADIAAAETGLTIVHRGWVPRDS
jgi:hypothetical protein